MADIGDDGSAAVPAENLRKLEIRMFLFLTVVLAPALSVAIVGGLGFAIWIFQAIAGPPGPPA